MIRFTDVSFRYGTHAVLENVSFEIKPGDFVFLVGQTGSGKSTLLKLMYMDLKPTSGTVVVGKYISSSISRECDPASSPHTRDHLPGLPVVRRPDGL